MTTRKVWHIIPKDNNWAIKKEGADRLSGIHDNKQDAIKEVQKIAKNNTPSQIIVHDKHGVIQTEWTYGKDPYSPKG